jgi:hypothetical protein
MIRRIQAMGSILQPLGHQPATRRETHSRRRFNEFLSQMRRRTNC